MALREDLERITVSSKRGFRVTNPTPPVLTPIQFDQSRSCRATCKPILSRGDQSVNPRRTDCRGYLFPAGPGWAGGSRSTPGRWAPGRPPHHGRGRTPSRPGRERTGQNGPRRATTAPGAGNAPNPARTASRGPPRSAPPPPYLPGTQDEPTAPATRQVNKISHFFDCSSVNKMC